MFIIYLSVNLHITMILHDRKDNNFPLQPVYVILWTLEIGSRSSDHDRSLFDQVQFSISQGYFMCFSLIFLKLLHNNTIFFIHCALVKHWTIELSPSEFDYMLDIYECVNWIFSLFMFIYIKPPILNIFHKFILKVWNVLTRYLLARFNSPIFFTEKKK